MTLADGNAINGLTISSPSGVGITGTAVNALTVGSAGGHQQRRRRGLLSRRRDRKRHFGAAITNAVEPGGIDPEPRRRHRGALRRHHASGTGILLDNNTGGSTFNFSGGVTLNGTSATFTATNSGT